MRQFQYSKALMGLSNNSRHNFALNHTLAIYESNAAYTFIPKNACSTLRYSIAKANGCVDNINSIDWIHPNNRTFSMTTESAFKADYTFIILRCPFSRLFSSFMDKLVNMDIQSWQYRNARGRTFHPHDLTFDWFIKDLDKAPNHLWDIHWRPQVDFMVYTQYDDVFRLEDFTFVKETLKNKIGLTLYDTRPYLNHETSSLHSDPAIQSPSLMPALDLLNLKRSGKIPDVSKMFTNELVTIVRKFYTKDIDIYLKYFPPSPLMNKLLQ